MMNAALNIKDYGYTSGMPYSGIPEQPNSYQRSWCGIEI